MVGRDRPLSPYPKTSDTSTHPLLLSEMDICPPSERFHPTASFPFISAPPTLPSLHSFGAFLLCFTTLQISPSSPSFETSLPCSSSPHAFNRSDDTQLGAVDAEPHFYLPPPLTHPLGSPSFLPPSFVSRLPLLRLLSSSFPCGVIPFPPVLRRHHCRS